MCVNFGDGLLTADGDGWLSQRRALSPDFSVGAVDAFSGTIEKATEELVRDWRTRAALGESVDVVAAINRFTLAVAAQTLFGASLGSDSDAFLEAFSTSVEPLTERTLATSKLPLSVPTPGNVRFNRAVRTLDRVLAVMLEGARASAVDASFYARLTKLAESSEPPWLRDQVLTFLLASNDTTASLLCWALQLLALHPDIATRVATDDELLTGVLWEALRLYPPVPLIGRDTLEDDVIGGYRIPAGTAVYAVRLQVWW